jgi:hypothetical protein
MAATGQVVILESVVAAGFLLISVIGFKTNLWVLVVALVAHGIFDFVHHLFFDNPEAYPVGGRDSVWHLTSLLAAFWLFWC